MIPQIKTALGLSTAEPAFALLGQPIAIIPGLQIASCAMNVVGPRRILATGFLMQPLVYALPVNATGSGAWLAGSGDWRAS